MAFGVRRDLFVVETLHAVDAAVIRRHTGWVTTAGQDLPEEFRRQRRSGDPRLSGSDKGILRRIATGDLADVFALSLAAISDADPLLGGDPATDGGPSGFEVGDGADTFDRRAVAP